MKIIARYRNTATEVDGFHGNGLNSFEPGCAAAVAIDDRAGRCQYTVFSTKKFLDVFHRSKL